MLRAAFILTFLALAFTATTTVAQQPTPKKSTSQRLAVVVEGNQRIETATVVSFMELPEGTAVTDDDINRSLNNLFATGFFADVSIRREDGKLVVRVIENPIINQVAFEGNKRIDDEILSAEVRLKPRAIYTKSALQGDLKRILDIYKKSGRFSAQVEPKVIQLQQNRVDLVFEIDEGERTEISRIAFVGNNAFGDNRLRSVIQTKETRWYRFFSSDDTYDPDRIAFDKELLRRHYVSHGYADFRVLSVTSELTPAQDAFYLAYAVEEGPAFAFGDMQVESHLPELRTDQLQSLLLTKSGDTFNADLIEKTIEKFTEELGNLGYAFVKIDPQYLRDAENNTIGLKYVVEEGPRVYVESINIHGNIRTMDDVVRREFRLQEGDPYNADRLKRSRQRVENLDFFNKVDITTRQGSAPDRVAIDVDVEEKSTGELTFGAGFSTTDGALGDISLSERNLLGKGQFLKLNLTISSLRQEIDLSFTEPYFMERNVAAGFDLFDTKQNNDSSRSRRSFDLDSQGGVLRASYPVTEHLTHTVNYSLRSDEITDIDATASLFVKRQEGENITSLIGHNLIYDKRDSKIKPTEGYYIRFNEDLAGAGGDAKFFRNELRGYYYIPTFSREWVLSFSGKGGYILGYGSEDVRINDRFFVGGRDLRGFDNEGIGPRDQATRDPLGGNAYAIGSAELSFPLGLPEELGVSGSVFTDVGTLFDVDDEDTIDPATGTLSRVLDKSSPRAAAGVGMAWTSPLGPIRIDLSHAFQKEDFDETEQLRFSFGTRF